MHDGGDLPASRPERIAASRIYRWRPSEGTTGCEAKHHRFFRPDPADPDRAFRAVRLLAAAQRAAREQKQLPFEVGIDDREALSVRQFAETNTDTRIPPTIEETTPITDGRQALLSVPVSSVSWTGDYGTVWDSVIKPEDLVSQDGRRLDGTVLFAGGLWMIGLITAGEDILRIRIRREVPPPF